MRLNSGMSVFSTFRDIWNHFDNYAFGFCYVRRPWTCSKDRPSNKRERRGKNLDDGEFGHFILFCKLEHWQSFSIITSNHARYSGRVQGWKVGGCLLFEHTRHELVLKFRCLELLFSMFSSRYLGQENNQTYDYIFLCYVFKNCSFIQNLNSLEQYIIFFNDFFSH